jgi:hypothetical protein
LIVGTTLSLRRYTRRFGLRNLEAHRLADNLLERLEVPSRCPHLQLRIVPAMEPDDDVFTSIVDFQTRNWLRVAAVETLRDAEDRCESAYGPAKRRRELRILRMRTFRRPAPMITSHQSHHLDLIRMEAAQVAVLDQVVGMLVMAGEADVAADVMHQRRIFQPFALAVRQPMDRARLIE